MNAQPSPNPAGLQRVAQPSRRFAQPHRKIDHRLQTVRISRRQSGAMRKHKLRVAQNPGERIIDLMTEYFRRFCRKTSPRSAQRCFRAFRPSQSPLHQASRESGEIPRARDEIQISFRHESCDLRLPGCTGHQNQGRCFA